jgi:hypothetical protein
LPHSRRSLYKTGQVSCSAFRPQLSRVEPFKNCAAVLGETTNTPVCRTIDVGPAPKGSATSALSHLGVVKLLRLDVSAETFLTWRMFNDATSGHCCPTYLSSDNDPLFQYHRWKANLRVLDIEEIKSLPHAPMSHPFVERLIGSIRRELLDRTLFWTATDLENKLLELGIRQGQPPRRS